MKILVCISCVPDTTSKINFKNNDTEFDNSQIQYIINPNDEFGLTRAIWFKENDGAEIDVISVGLDNNDQILRKALAIGADSAFRINQEALDSFQVAKLLSNHIANNNYDLVIAGRESIEYKGGMVPGIIAEILKYKYVMNPLNVTWAPHLFTDIGFKNFNNWMRIGGLDNLLFTPNGLLHKRLTSLAFKNLLHQSRPDRPDSSRQATHSSRTGCMKGSPDHQAHRKREICRQLAYTEPTRIHSI